MEFAVGLGLTNDCNLACAHCYRDVNRIDNLSLDDVKRLCSSIPVGAVNLGTGENALNPEFERILEYLREEKIKTTVTTNGFSVSTLSDDLLRNFHDVEFSLDFPTELDQDAFRGKGNWRLIMDQIERCGVLGVAVAITAVMMRINYELLPEVARIARERGAALRVNIYQPVKTDAFTLTYEQYWEGFRRLFAESSIIACNEPLVRAFLELGGPRSGCGFGTVRLTPRGEVLPCVYWPERTMHLAELEKLGAAVTSSPPFEQARVIPDFCRGCVYEETCGGGCPGRRMLRGRLDEPDEYCPFLREGSPPKLDFSLAEARDMPKAASACTTIVIAK